MRKKVKTAAAFWKRVIAYIIDSILITFIIVIPFMADTSSQTVSSFSDLWSSASTSFTGDVFIVTLIIALLTLLYWSFLEFKFSQSVGKIILNIGVSNTKKKPITFGQAMLRNITKLSTILLVADVLYLLVKKGNQRYTEVLSNTMVLEVKK